MSEIIDDPLVATLEHLLDGQEGNTKLLAEIARDLGSIGNQVTGANEEFSRLHGELQAMEIEEAGERKRMHDDIRKIGANVELVRKSVESILLRLTDQAGRLEKVETELLRRSANGNDNG